MSELVGSYALGRRLDALASPRLRMRLLETLATAVVEEANRRVPRKTGMLARSITVTHVDPRRATVKARQGYAAYVEHGTGIYGPEHRRITPRTKKALAWRTGAVRLSGRSKVRGGRQLAGWAFARSVKGAPARPYLRPGAAAAMKRTNEMAAKVIDAWNEAG